MKIFKHKGHEVHKVKDLFLRVRGVLPWHQTPGQVCLM